MTPLRPGTLFQGHEVLEFLGSGGAGAVYRCRHRSLRREVALKLIQGSGGEFSTHRKRFLREAQALSRVSHPHVVRVFEFGDQGDLLYYTMELAQGRSLDRHLRRDGPLALPSAIEVLMELLDGLGAVHEQGVFHRDIKPANILLHKERGVLLCDFGLALDTELTRLTMQGAMLGTLLYFPPELCREEEVDGRADLYQCGISFHEALTGDVPFDGEALVGMIRGHWPDRSPMLSNLENLFGLRVRQFVDRATAWDPDDRFPDAPSMRRAAAALLCTEDSPDTLRTSVVLGPDTDVIAAPRKPSPSPPRGPEQPEPAAVPTSNVSRHLALAAAGGGLLCVVLALALWLAWGQSSTPPPTGPIERVSNPAIAPSAATSVSTPPPPPLPGESVTWHPNGVMKSRAVLVDGRLHGPWESWHANGRRHEQGQFEDGSKVGEWRTWYENGHIALICRYREGRLHGEARYFHPEPEGALKEEGRFQNGKEEGVWQGWDAHGRLRGTLTFRAGRRYGTARYRHPDGSLRKEGAFVDDRRHGPWTFYYPGGQPRESGRYEDDWRTGVWSSWSPDGHLIARSRYSRGRLLRIQEGDS